ncbi:MAG: LysM peptidoglycan-binding domain-containing protein, partial [Anaerolineae bacterium]|nr:LysM peptidoglycan-binding domain-containing protein [Anaerolineae bacterium]
MNLKRFSVLFILVGLLLFGVWLPAGAAPSAQQYVTPTPGADGRILYIVQAGDNCFRVAALHGISVDQLLQLNSDLDETCTLFEGQELLIGIVSVATPTVQAAFTAGAPTVTPTPLSGLTEVCVLLFEDGNGNAMREELEPAIAGGAVSVTENNGKYSASLDTILPADTTVYPGVCFTNIPEGMYNITVAIPDNYNATTELSYTLEVNAGDRAFVPFGAQSQDVVADPGTEDDGSAGGTSTVLGIFGALLLL